MKILISLSLITLCWSSAWSSTTTAKTCVYTLDKKSVKVEWTAFKTTKKVGVKGSFNSVSVKGSESAADLVQLLSGLKYEIDTKTVETKNPQRNKTIADNFFLKMAAPGKISGNAKNIDAGKKTGVLVINMNDQDREIPMAYEMKNGLFTAKGSIDILKFAAKPAFDALHKACKDLHRGADGKTKTWSDVEIQLQAKIKEDCK